MKTRQQAAETYINENRKNLNDSVFTIARSDLYAHWNDAFLAGCEFEAQNRWIPVSERPDKYGEYWVYRQKANKVHKETWNGTGWAYNGNQITHWMPLPEKP